MSYVSRNFLGALASGAFLMAVSIPAMAQVSGDAGVSIGGATGSASVSTGGGDTNADGSVSFGDTSGTASIGTGGGSTSGNVMIGSGDATGTASIGTGGAGTSGNIAIGTTDTTATASIGTSGDAASVAAAINALNALGVDATVGLDPETETPGTTPAGVAAPDTVQAALANLTDAQLAAYKKTCKQVLGGGFDANLVALCKMVQTASR